MEHNIVSRAGRFLGVTLLTAPLGQVLIYVFFAVLGMPGLVANALALLLIATLNLILSLKFIWVGDSGGALHRHVVMFVLASLLSLALSSVGVAIAVAVSDSNLAANVGSLVGYGLGWVLRFAVLDRYFTSQAPTADISSI